MVDKILDYYVSFLQAGYRWMEKARKMENEVFSGRRGKDSLPLVPSHQSRPDVRQIQWAARQYKDYERLSDATTWEDVQENLKVGVRTFEDLEYITACMEPIDPDTEMDTRYLLSGLQPYYTFVIAGFANLLNLTPLEAKKIYPNKSAEWLFCQRARAMEARANALAAINEYHGTVAGFGNPRPNQGAESGKPKSGQGADD